MQKGFSPLWIILIVLAIFVVTAIYLFINVNFLFGPAVGPLKLPPLSPLPSSAAESANIASWQIYQDESGFSFKYPPSWSLIKNREHKTDTYTENFIISPVSSEGMSAEYQLTVTVIENNNSLSTKDFIESHKSEKTYPNLTVNSFEKPTSSLGISGDWLIDYRPPGAGPGLDALIPYQKKMIALYCGNCSLELFNQILSTFKFIP